MDGEMAEMNSDSEGLVDRRRLDEPIDGIKMRFGRLDHKVDDVKYRCKRGRKRFPTFDHFQM